MSNSTHLFQLIHSLSQSEKRYFKIFCSSQSGNKSYVQLFDAIVKQKNYDETKLKKQLKIGAFAVAKTYLYNLIMRSLRSQETNQNVSMQIKNLLKNMEILFQKGLYEQMDKMLIRARKLALENEKFPFLLEIYQWEYQVANQTINAAEHKRMFEDNLKRVSVAIEKYMEQMEHRKIMNIIMYKQELLGKHTRHEKERKAFYNQAKSLLEKDPKTILSYKSVIYNYSIKENFYYNNNDLDGFYLNSKNTLKYMESNPKLLLQEINNYMLVIYKLIDIQMRLHKYEEIKPNINKLKLIETNASTMVEKSRAFGFYAGKEVNYYLHTNNYKEGLTIIPLIENQLNKYNETINTLSKYSIYVAIVELYFVYGKTREALNWNNKILNDSAIESFYEYNSNSRISEIIIHYELNNLEKVESLLKSFSLFLKKNKVKQKYEYSLIQFFKKVILIEDADTLKKEFILFHKKLLLLESDPSEKETFDFFDLLSWLKSKIENRPFATIMEEKNKK